MHDNIERKSILPSGSRQWIFSADLATRMRRAGKDFEFSAKGLGLDQEAVLSVCGEDKLF